MRNFIEEKQKTTLDFVQETQYEALDFEFQARPKIERPSFRLQNWGAEFMEDAELLCITLPNPDWKKTQELAHRILAHFNHRFSDIAKASIYDLCQIEGVTERAAQKIYATFAISKRRQLEEVPLYTQIKGSKDAYNVIAPVLNDLPHEEFWVLMLNRANKVINRVKISQGGVSGTVVDNKVLFKAVLANSCSSIVLCHNHPSGNKKPSQADIDITKKLKAAGKVLDIVILDHIIVAADNGYYSFVDEGML